MENWNEMAINEIMAIKTDDWAISSWDGVLLNGKNGLSLANALTVFIDSGFVIDHYTRSFSSGALIVFVEQ